YEPAVGSSLLMQDLGDNAQYQMVSPIRQAFLLAGERDASGMSAIISPDRGVFRSERDHEPGRVPIRTLAVGGVVSTRFLATAHWLGRVIDVRFAPIDGWLVTLEDVEGALHLRVRGMAAEQQDDPIADVALGVPADDGARVT